MKKNVVNIEVINRLKYQIDNSKNNILFIVLIPVGIFLLILILNIFYKIFRVSSLFAENRWIRLAIFGTSLMLFCGCYWGNKKRKRIYNAIGDGNIIIQEAEIVKIKRYHHKNNGSCLNNTYYYLVLNDGNKNYKTSRFRKKQVEIDKRGFDRDDIIKNFNSHELIIPNIFKIESIKIKGKKYSMGDKVNIYIDPQHKRNYIIDIGY